MTVWRRSLGEAPPQTPGLPPATWETVINSPKAQAAIQAAQNELAAYPAVLALFNAFLREGPAWTSRVLAALPEAAKKARELVLELDAKVRHGRILPPAARTAVFGIPIWVLAGGVGLFLLLKRR